MDEEESPPSFFSPWLIYRFIGSSHKLLESYSFPLSPLPTATNWHKNFFSLLPLPPCVLVEKQPRRPTHPLLHFFPHNEISPTICEEKSEQEKSLFFDHLLTALFWNIKGKREGYVKIGMGSGGSRNLQKSHLTPPLPTFSAPNGANF